MIEVYGMCFRVYLAMFALAVDPALDFTDNFAFGENIAHRLPPRAAANYVRGGNQFNLAADVFPVIPHKNLQCLFVGMTAAWRLFQVHHGNTFV